MLKKNKNLKIKCPKCGKILSGDAIKKAEEKSRKKLEAAMKELGTISVRKDWEIKCDSCGEKIVYNPFTGQVN